MILAVAFFITQAVVNWPSLADRLRLTISFYKLSSYAVFLSGYVLGRDNNFIPK